MDSFGFGDTNAHVVLEARDSLIKDPNLRKGFVFSSHGSSLFGLDSGLEEDAERPYVLALSANDEYALEAIIQTLSHHLGDPAVGVKLSDVAYTLSERRTHHFHRGFVVSNSLEISPDSMVLPLAKAVVQNLDKALQTLPHPPEWSLVKELCEPREGAVLRLPEFSQSLVTVLQIEQLAVLSHWGISATRVLGHSSGEIAAAVAAGLV